MALYPKAEVKLLSKKYSGFRRLAYYNRMNLHIAVSRAKSLFSFFNRSGRPSSHFYIRKSGHVLQYVDTAFQAEADLEGNDATISVETEGGVYKPNSRKWTAAQVQAMAELFAWVHKTHGIQMRLATSSKLGSASKGLSWHRLGIDGNFPSSGILRGRLQRGGGMHYSSSRGKICPGDARIKQIPGILERAKDTKPGVVVWRKYMTPGDRGPDIKAAQRALNKANAKYGFTTRADLVDDGVYGDITEAFTLAFQRFVDGLPELDCEKDGNAGPETQGYLVGDGADLVLEAWSEVNEPEPEPEPERPEWEPVDSRAMYVWEKTEVVNPFTGERLGAVEDEGLEIASKVQVDGVTYYRTDWSTRQDNDSGVDARDLHDTQMPGADPELSPDLEPQPEPSTPSKTGGIIAGIVLALAAILSAIFG